MFILKKKPRKCFFQVDTALIISFPCSQQLMFCRQGMLNLGNNTCEEAFGLCDLLLQDKLFAIFNVTSNLQHHSIQRSCCTTTCLATNVDHSFCCSTYGKLTLRTSVLILCGFNITWKKKGSTGETQQARQESQRKKRGWSCAFCSILLNSCCSASILIRLFSLK